MTSRRDLLHLAFGGVAAAGLSAIMPRLATAAGAPVSPGVPAGVTASAVLEALPGKKPLIKLTYRPPNYETPLQYFDQVLTPNDAFFVRYHLARIPEVDLRRVEAQGRRRRGRAARSSSRLDELRRGFPRRRSWRSSSARATGAGLSDPHVQGVEWGYGAMGNARWKGVRLKDVLAKAGVKKEAVEVAFDGADGGVVDETPGLRQEPARSGRRSTRARSSPGR